MDDPQSDTFGPIEYTGFLFVLTILLLIPREARTIASVELTIATAALGLALGTFAGGTFSQVNVDRWSGLQQLVVLVLVLAGLVLATWLLTPIISYSTLTHSMLAFLWGLVLPDLYTLVRSRTGQSTP